MPSFKYQATNDRNQIIKGALVAPTQEEVAVLLKKQNLNPITIKSDAKRQRTTGSLTPIDKISFCRYMSTMITAGLPLTEGLPGLKNESKNPLLRQIIDDIMYGLERGQPLHASLSNYPKTFDHFFLTLITTGEVSGTLAESFKYLEQQLRADYSLSQKIKSAMVYPSIIFIAMIGIGFLMFFFVLPQIGQVFLSMTIPLPAFTRGLFTFAVTIARFRYPLIALIIIVMVGLFLFLRTAKGKHLVLKLVSPLPVVSRLLQQIDIARFCRIFSTLVASAVPIGDSLSISLSSLSHPKFKPLAQTVPPAVLKGKPIAAAFGENHTFPALLIQMINAGEKSGTLDTSLGDLASFYEEEVEEAVKKTTQMIEPLVMLMVGIGVGAMILMIIAPLYSVVGNLQQASQQ